MPLTPCRRHSCTRQPKTHNTIWQSDKRVATESHDKRETRRPITNHALFRLLSVKLLRSRGTSREAERDLDPVIHP